MFISRGTCTGKAQSTGPTLMPTQSRSVRRDDSMNSLVWVCCTGSAMLSPGLCRHCAKAQNRLSGSLLVNQTFCSGCWWCNVPRKTNPPSLFPTSYCCIIITQSPYRYSCTDVSCNIKASIRILSLSNCLKIYTVHTCWAFLECVRW